MCEIIHAWQMPGWYLWMIYATTEMIHARWSRRDDLSYMIHARWSTREDLSNIINGRSSEQRWFVKVVCQPLRSCLLRWSPIDDIAQILSRRSAIMESCRCIICEMISACMIFRIQVLISLHICTENSLHGALRYKQIQNKIVCIFPRTNWNDMWHSNSLNVTS